MALEVEGFEETRRRAVERLLSQRNEAGHWVGRLSSSALSTATATIALSMLDEANDSDDHAELIERGVRWLQDHQNDDGGWGDTDRSHSNISTTVLVWSALGRLDPTCEHLDRTDAWLRDQAGSLEPDRLTWAIDRRYGTDRTFSVPILMTALLCGRMGDPNEKKTWRRLSCRSGCSDS